MTDQIVCHGWFYLWERALLALQMMSFTVAEAYRQAVEKAKGSAAFAGWSNNGCVLRGQDDTECVFDRVPADPTCPL